MDRLVFGLGSPDRGDDAVGSVVARQVAMQGLRAVRVVEHEDPTCLIDQWADLDLAVIVDAVRSGGAPGELVILEAGVDSTPLPEKAWERTGRGGTHALGLAAAVELGRALHLLPRRLVLVGVEAAGFDYGAPLSVPVAAKVGAAVEAVIAILAAHTMETPDVSR